MTGIMPQIPEQVTHETYENMRDDCLKPADIQAGRPYTFRMRHKNPTAEFFAYDTLSIVTKIRNLGRYCVVNAKIRDYNGILLAEFGVSNPGIAFNHVPLPKELDYIEYKYEVGYFVGDAGESFSGTRVHTEADELNEGDVVELRRHMALTA